MKYLFVDLDETTRVMIRHAVDAHELNMADMMIDYLIQVKKFEMDKILPLAEVVEFHETNGSAKILQYDGVPGGLFVFPMQDDEVEDAKVNTHKYLWKYFPEHFYDDTKMH